MRWVVVLAVLFVVGCSFRLPTPAQQAQLNELGAEQAELLEEIDALAVKLKKGEITLDEFKTAAQSLYAKVKVVEANIQKVVDSGAPLWSVIANGVLTVALFLFGGKRNLPVLVGNVLERVGKKAKGKK